MNSSWLKIAVAVVLVTVIVILVRNFLPSKTRPQPQEEPKSFYDVIEEDDRRLRAEPQQPPPQEQEPHIEKPTERTGLPQEPSPRQFKELSETEKIEAERLFEMAITQRKMGRLPGVGYKQMVDYCRQIIEKFPGSEYEFKAKRILADIPERYRKQYNITDEEIKIDN